MPTNIGEGYFNLNRHMKHFYDRIYRFRRQKCPIIFGQFKTKTAIVCLLRDLLVDYRTGQDPLVASLRTNELDSQTRCR